MSLLLQNAKSGKLSLSSGGKVVKRVVSILGDIATAIEKENLTEAEAKRDLAAAAAEVAEIFAHVLQSDDAHKGQRVAHGKDCTVLGQCLGLRFTAAMSGASWK